MFIRWSSNNFLWYFSAWEMYTHTANGAFDIFLRLPTNRQTTFLTIIYKFAIMAFEITLNFVWWEWEQCILGIDATAWEINSFPTIFVPHSPAAAGFYSRLCTEDLHIASETPKILGGHLKHFAYLNQIDCIIRVTAVIYISAICEIFR